MIWLVAFIAIVFLGAIIVALILQQKQQAKLLDQLAQALGGIRSGHTIRGTRDGISYRIEYFAGSRYQQSYLKAAIPCQVAAGSFRVARETKMEIWMDRLGGSSQLKTGDPLFDRDFAVLTDTMPFASAVFQRPEKRDAIRGSRDGSDFR